MWPKDFWQREALGKKGEDIRESFHLPHTVYLSALHGSQAALKSRLPVTHPAGIKQFSSSKAASPAAAARAQRLLLLTGCPGEDGGWWREVGPKTASDLPQNSLRV